MTTAPAPAPVTAPAPPAATAGQTPSTGSAATPAATAELVRAAGSPQAAVEAATAQRTQAQQGLAVARVEQTAAQLAVDRAATPVERDVARTRLTAAVAAVAAAAETARSADSTVAALEASEAQPEVRVSPSAFGVADARPLLQPIRDATQSGGDKMFTLLLLVLGEAVLLLLGILAWKRGWGS